MSKSSILKNLQILHSNFVDDNGEFLNKPAAKLKDLTFTDEQVRLIKYTITMVMSTNIISDEAKLYIKYSRASVMDIFDKIRKTKRFDPDETLTFSALNSKIYRDNTKLDNILGSNFYTDLLDNSGNLSKYFEIISSVFAKASGGSKVRDLIVLDIPTKELVTRCDREKLDELIKIIRPYLKAQMDAIVDALDKQAVGYFNFLLCSPPEMLPVQARQDRSYLIYNLTGEKPDDSEVEVEQTSTRIVYSDENNETDAEILGDNKGKGSLTDSDSLDGNKTKKKSTKTKKETKKQKNPHEEQLQITGGKVDRITKALEIEEDIPNVTDDEESGFEIDADSFVGLFDDDDKDTNNSKNVAPNSGNHGIYELGHPDIPRNV